MAAPFPIVPIPTNVGTFYATRRKGSGAAQIVTSTADADMMAHLFGRADLAGVISPHVEHEGRTYNVSVNARPSDDRSRVVLGSMYVDENGERPPAGGSGREWLQRATRQETVMALVGDALHDAFASDDALRARFVALFD